MEPRQYTTGRGVTVGVIAIPMLLDAIQDAHPLPDLPTYAEELAGGAIQHVPISEEEAVLWAEHNPDSWADQAEKWAAYELERDTTQELLNDRVWRAIMLQSMVLDLPEDSTWIEEQERLGLTVPTSPIEQRIHYIRTEVVSGMPDIWKITAMANGAYMSEEALRVAEASFRHSLAQSLLEGLKAQARAVETGTEGGDNESSESVGDSPE